MRAQQLAVRGVLLVALLSAAGSFAQTEPAGASERYEYRLLATNKTSTMEKELNQMAEQGFRFGGVMGGETSFGGSEVVVIVGKAVSAQAKARYAYKLLATSKTSTMQKELQQAAGLGFEYRGQTVFKSTFGGEEVVLILERDLSVSSPTRYAYQLLATTKTSTMQKELQAAGEEGFELVGLTVAETAFGGNEIVAIMRRAAQ